jgi:hypothetical protein
LKTISIHELTWSKLSKEIGNQSAQLGYFIRNESLGHYSMIHLNFENDSNYTMFLLKYGDLLQSTELNFRIFKSRVNMASRKLNSIWICDYPIDDLKV